MFSSAEQNHISNNLSQTNIDLINNYRRHARVILYFKVFRVNPLRMLAKSQMLPWGVGLGVLDLPILITMAGLIF